MIDYSLAEIAQAVAGEVQGNANHRVSRIATLEQADATALSFFANSKYRSQLTASQAGVILLRADDAVHTNTNCIFIDNPYWAYSVISHWFKPKFKDHSGIHPSAVINPSAHIAAHVSIASGVVIEAGAIIGAHTIIGANSYIGHEVEIGEGCWLAPNVTLYQQVKLGARVKINSQTVIGADGFGYAWKNTWHPVAQLGRVIIEDDVQIGASTTIDRGAINDTRIGRGVIIDNQVQIAHNVEIGEYTAIAGCAGVAGSTKIGRRCQIAGAAGIAGHLEITDNVFIGMQAQVTRSISEPGSYSSGTGLWPSAQWRKWIARLRRTEKKHSG